MRGRGDDFFKDIMGGRKAAHPPSPHSTVFLLAVLPSNHVFASFNRDEVNQWSTHVFALSTIIQYFRYLDYQPEIFKI